MTGTRAVIGLSGIYLLVILMGVFPASSGSAERAPAQSYELNAGGFGGENLSSWPVFIAQEKGFLAKEGINLTLTRSQEKMAGLLGGSFDVISEAAETSILAAVRGGDIVVTYDLIRTPPQFMLLGPGVNTVAELEGKIIGVWRIPSTDQLLIKKFLAKKGIDINKVTFRMLGGSRERFAALRAGQISATLLDPVFAISAQEEGLKLIASPSDWGVYPWAQIVFKRKWATSHSDLVIKYVRALQQGTAWLANQANFNEAIRILTPLARFNDKTMIWALQATIDNKLYNLEKPNPAILQLAAEWLLAEGLLTKPFDVATIIDAKYYEHALK